MKDNVLDGHILNIVQNCDVREQLDLQKILKDRGFDIPQATLSRRLKKLKIAKVSGTYKIIDFNQPYIPIVLNFQISDTGFFVLHTYPGQANALAYYLDQKYVSFSNAKNQNSVILGTIAGDDTVLIILKSLKLLNAAKEIIYEEFSYLKKDSDIFE